jgi:hypothetical protein
MAIRDDAEQRLHVLWAKQEIHDALMRYCRGIDRCDVDLVLSAFHPDAVDNHTGPEEPIAERVPRAIERARANVVWTSHQICNELVHVDGDVADSECYLLAYHRVDHEGRPLDWILGARYVDRFELRDGRWRIAHRAVIFDWERFDFVVDPPQNAFHKGFFAQGHQAVRDRSDFSYHHLRTDELIR